MLELDASHDYVVLGDCAEVLPRLADGAFQLIYVDPPFNTGGVRHRRTLSTVRDEHGDRVGFGGRRYRTTELSDRSFPDSFDDYASFLGPRLEDARRLLAEDGTLYVHLDYREAHRVKLLLDDVFGADCFLNEIVWAYDYGGRPRDRWPAKHDTILVYVRRRGSHVFDAGAVERIPYMAPGLVGEEKARRGKLPTDVWWHTIVPTSGRERTGYPTQKPEGVLRRIVAASSVPGARVLDFFAGSGTTGAVARELGRRFVLVDESPGAVEVMGRRLGTDAVRYLAADGRTLDVPAGPAGATRPRGARTDAGTPRAVCVFCGSSTPPDPAYRRAARALGDLLAARGVTLVYGGGRVGLMGELADACLERGGRVVGVIPSGLFEREVAHHGLTELVEVATMHERKQRMYDLADGFVALPGGLGTLEELAEVTTWSQLGIHTKPIVLLDVEGFWGPLVAQLDRMVEVGLLRAENRRLVRRAPSGEEALSVLASPPPEHVAKWLEPEER